MTAEAVQRGVLNQAGPAELGTDEIEKRVKIRAERQRILEGDDPVRLFVVIDEAALRRTVGGPDIMRAQLDHLIKMAARANITLQVIPFDVGPHPGTGGRFTIISFPAEDPDAVYIETIAGELLIESEGVGRYRRAFRRLNAEALSPEDTIALIGRIAGS
ncbi:DUF5753 domain-containing protein [Actinoallomurus purpureus]|uniref:DUF5753 domain-containing protein n=1 Tax=Actinoallomurus purpureus TaxID=478114 RepID=UPI002093E63C|nr:DUF5753 domain-containing protein [Actinoallomurus purpureus]MCO6011209.1 DUF5753 domain-containing protein [Actinoallomurus purpureus]